LVSTSNDGTKPLRYGGNVAASVIRRGDPYRTPHSEEGEKELVHELMHPPEKRPRKKWTHEETENLVRGCNKVHDVSLLTTPALSPPSGDRPSVDP
jgi:hypothetical protein